MTSFGFLLSKAMRNCLTITMVCMIKEINSTAILDESAGQVSYHSAVNSTFSYGVSQQEPWYKIHTLVDELLLRCLWCFVDSCLECFLLNNLRQSWGYWLAPMGGAKQQLMIIFLSKLHFRNYFISKLSSQFLDGQLRTKKISYECPLSVGSGSKLPGRLYCNWAPLTPHSLTAWARFTDLQLCTV